MSRLSASNRLIDAKPDRVDHRDRMYQPRLASLPRQYPDADFVAEHFHNYHKLVLDQGAEGACVGFGLAAVINYLRYKNSLETDRPGEITPVSARMLHTMARFYDEWPGEDYQGTSCRGAIKGWFRHGVCSDATWPYRKTPRHKATFIRPAPNWQQEALKTPLGAYFRVHRDSITDMQSALCEAGALYVSAKYHAGWDDIPFGASEMPVLKLKGKSEGAHAFAIVGYTPTGFILQNSWGPKWGFKGFAIITYDDWLKNAEDVWVAMLGAPVELDGATETLNVRARRRMGITAAAGLAKHRKHVGSILAPADAYQHTVVIADNGAPSNRFLDIETAARAVRETVFVLPKQWLKANRSRKIVVYAQSCLTDEEMAIDRVRVLAPRFLNNGVYPVFLSARGGFRQDLARVVDNAVVQFMNPATRAQASGIDKPVPQEQPESHVLFSGAEQSQESQDKSVELACQHMTVKPLWMQIKRNAETARLRAGALAEVARNLQKLKDSIRSLEIHFVGHSAGAQLIGHLLKRVTPMRLRIASCTLYAPACSVDFAVDYLLPAMRRGGPLRSRDLYIEVLTDRRELSDSVGHYGKSLLYLVSRGMEDVCGIPILGMEKVWNEKKWPYWPDDVAGLHLESLKAWRRFCRGRIAESGNLFVNNARSITVLPGKKRVPASHMDLDRDVRAITRTLERIRGRKLRTPI